MITGVVDIDTVGPGRRADDLACLLAHLSTVQRMSADQAIGLNRLLNLWMPVFEARVDPTELRLRAAAVVISLATGPYRSPAAAVGCGDCDHAQRRRGPGAQRRPWRARSAAHWTPVAGARQAVPQ